jgi:pimeloyl-ACP methyl ester carboxylesterase
MKKVYSIAMAAVILGLGAGAASTARSAPEAPAQDEGRMSQFVEIAPNRSLYVDYIRAQPGKPTVALVNGLTYRTGPGCWENFANALKKRGIGVFMWDQRGMGQTLLREGWPEGPIDYRDQVADMRAVLDKVGLSGPQHIVGLSYGGGEAAYFAATSPERIASLTLMSPYTEPVEVSLQSRVGQRAL